jgi:antitoxin (DNA-binding transcriptional repressor) of toxin-antitoxin stability system
VTLPHPVDSRKEVLPPSVWTTDQFCSYNGRPNKRFIGVRELRNKTGKVLSAVQKGEKVILAKRGKAFAAMARLREEEIERLILEGRGWLNLSESAFDFWNNDEDEAWNKI